MPTDFDPNAVLDPVRLAALDALDILDSPAEAGFDDIVHMASQTCGTPVALVSLVSGDRQWFKANVGFPHCETDLDRSVCAHVLTEPDLLVIPDLTADPRTSHNPLVTADPHIRFYAGAPLRLATGQVVGSLCVIDGTPRPKGLAPTQADMLRRLAGQVVAQLELRRALAERDSLLADHQAVLREREIQTRTQRAISSVNGDLHAILDVLVRGAMEAVPAAEAGVLELVDGDHLEYRTVVGTITHHLGLKVPLHGSLAGACALTGEPILVRDVLKDDRVKRDLIATLQLRSAVFAPVWRGDGVLGVLKLQSSKANAFAERDLHLARLFAGLATAGLTEAREAEAQRAMLASEARYRAVFDSASDYAIIVMDLHGRVTNWNEGAVKVLGWSANEMLGRTVVEIFTPEDRQAGIPEGEMRSALEVGRGADERWHLRKGGERFFGQGEMMALRYEGGDTLGFVKILRDRTEQQRLMERLATSERHKAALVELGDNLRDLSVVADMALVASGIIGRTLDADLVGYGEVDPGTETITIERDWISHGAVSLAGTVAFREFGSSVDDLKRGRTVAVSDARTDPRTAAFAPALEERSARAFVNTPVFERGTFVAMLYVSTGQPRSWTREELDFIRDVADRARTAMARVQAEHQQQMLNEELSHRLKNTLAMVQAIASQTLRKVGERNAVKAFNERLAALSKAHDVLLQQSWAAAPMRGVIEAVLSIQADLSRFDLTGPDLRLGPKAVLSLSLLLHELATNASKYGALSMPDGLVRLTWATAGHGTDATLSLTWTEEGGPPAAEPTRRGFGSRLIRLGLAGAGHSELRYDQTGLHATFLAPMSVITDH